MDCAEIREEFSALLDGELTPEMREIVEGHLAQCSACLRELERFKRVDVLYRQLPRETAPEVLVERVHNAVRPVTIRFRQPGVRRLALWPSLAAAAVFAMVAGIGYMQFHRLPPLRLASAPAERQTLDKAEPQPTTGAPMEVRTSPVATEKKAEAEATEPPTVLERIPSAAALKAQRGQAALSPVSKDEAAQAPAQAPRTSPRKRVDSVSTEDRMRALGYVVSEGKPMAAKTVPEARVASEELPAAPAAGPSPTVAGAVRADHIATEPVPEKSDEALGQLITPGAAVVAEGGKQPEEEAKWRLGQVEALPAPPPPVVEEFPREAKGTDVSPEMPKDVALGDKLQLGRESRYYGEATEPGLEERRMAVETAKVGERLFELRAGIWREEGYAGQPLTLLVRDTEEFRQFAEAHPDLKEALRLGDHVVFHMGEKWYEVKKSQEGG